MPDDKLTRYVDLATRLEMSAEVQARVQKIERREQLYHLDWATARKEGLLYALDTGPMSVGDHLMAKLTTRPFSLRCRSDIASAMADWQAQNILASIMPEDFSADAEQIKKLARDRADRVELAMFGLINAMEDQQGERLQRGIARNALVGFAGPVRILFDETAASEPNAVALRFQVLDPRSLFVVRDAGAGVGPAKLVYKRTATVADLTHEGWNLDLKTDDFNPDERVTIWDAWEKERSRTSLKLWHCIIADGGPFRQEFLKKPVDMAKARNLTRIPYAFRPVAPASYRHENYPGDSSHSMLDIFDPNWELSNLTLSFMAQMMQLAVDPPKVQSVYSPVEANFSIPGSDTIVQPGETVSVPRREFAEQNMSLVKEVIDTGTQRGSFPAASFGESGGAQSALMTGRLQGAGEVKLGDTKVAMQDCIADVCAIVAMLCPIYLKDKPLSIAMGPSIGLLDAQMFNGTERFECTISDMTALEEAQTAANWKQLSEPDAGGGRFISRETGREKSTVIAWDHTENERILREQEREIDMEARKKMAQDMEAQAVSEVNAQRAAQAEMAQMQQSMGQPQPQQPDPAQQAQGVPQTPVEGNAPMQQAEGFDPAQFQPGV